MVCRLSIIAAVTLLCTAGASAQTRVQRSTLGSGGVRAAGQAFSLQGTLGQSVIGKTIGNVHSAGLGFWYRAGQGTDAAWEAPSAAASLDIGANYPNPFGPGSASGSPGTRLEFQLASAGHIVLTVHDMMGQRRAVLVDERLEAGRYVAVLHAADLPAGVYLCRLVQGARHAERRLLLMR